MRQKHTDRTSLHTPQEWAAIAQKMARQAKQDFNARSGSPQRLPPYAIVVLLCVIACALVALLLPEAFDRVITEPQMDSRRSQGVWLKAHPVASFLYTAFMVAVTAAWFWYRMKLSCRATREEIERLRVKEP